MYLIHLRVRLCSSRNQRGFRFLREKLPFRYPHTYDVFDEIGSIAPSEVTLNVRERGSEGERARRRKGAHPPASKFRASLSVRGEVSRAPFFRAVYSTAKEDPRAADGAGATRRSSTPRRFLARRHANYYGRGGDGGGGDSQR